MNPERKLFGIPKPFPILDTPRPPTPEEQAAAQERFAKGEERLIVSREELAQKRDKAFGL